MQCAPDAPGLPGEFHVPSYMRRPISPLVFRVAGGGFATAGNPEKGLGGPPRVAINVRIPRASRGISVRKSFYGKPLCPNGTRLRCITPMTFQQIAFSVVSLLLVPVASLLAAGTSDPHKPASHSVRKIEGWTVRVDDRLLQPPHEALGGRILEGTGKEARRHQCRGPPGPPGETPRSDHRARYVPWKAASDAVPSRCPVAGRERLRPRPRALRPYSRGGRAPGPAADQRAAVVRDARTGDAYHDQVLGFDEARIRDAYAAYKKSGHGNSALLITGGHVRHYALTDHKEFFAEMTESYFGTNDFFPFNRAELMEAEPEIYKLLEAIWGPVQTERDQAWQDVLAKRGRESRPRIATRQDAPAAPLPGPQPRLGRDAPVVRAAGAKWDEALPVGNGRLGAMVFGDSGQSSASSSTSKPSGPAVPTIRRDRAAPRPCLKYAVWCSPESMSRPRNSSARPCWASPSSR